MKSFPLFFCVFSVFFLQAQPRWQQINVPGSGFVDYLYEHENTIYAHSYEQRLVAKKPVGEDTWSILNLPADYSFFVRQIETDGQWHFVRSYGSLYRVKEGMSEWENVAPDSTSGLNVAAIAVVQNRILAVKEQTIYYSDDAGGNWIGAFDYQGDTNGKIYFYDYGDTIYLKLRYAILKSEDIGETWEVVFNSSDRIGLLAVTEGTQLLMSEYAPKKVYRSQDGFKTFEEYTHTNFDFEEDGLLNFHSDTLFFSKLIDSKPYYWFSTDFAKTWTKVPLDYSEAPSFGQYFGKMFSFQEKWWFPASSGVYSVASEKGFEIEYEGIVGQPFTDFNYVSDNRIWIRTWYGWYYADKSDETNWFCLGGTQPDERGFCRDTTSSGYLLQMSDAMIHINNALDKIWAITDEGVRIELDFPANQSFDDFDRIGVTKGHFWLYNDDIGLIRTGADFKTWEKIPQLPVSEVMLKDYRITTRYGYLIIYLNDEKYITLDEGETWETIPDFGCANSTFGTNNSFLFEKRENQKLWVCDEGSSVKLYFETPDLPIHAIKAQNWETGVPLSTASGPVYKDENRIWFFDKEQNRLYFSEHELTQFYTLQPSVPEPIHYYTMASDRDGVYVGTHDQGLWQCSPFLEKTNGKENESLYIYPNPAQTHITIQSHNALRRTHVSVEIIDAVGRIVHTSKANMGYFQTLGVAFLPSGTYVVRVFSGDLMLRGKFIKI